MRTIPRAIDSSVRIRFSFTIWCLWLTVGLSQVVIDGKGHLLGRLASVVAKQLLSGQKIVVVRAEALNISGEFFRAKCMSIHCRIFSIAMCRSGVDGSIVWDLEMKAGTMLHNR